MSDLNKGEVALTLRGTEQVLKPSLAAFSQLAAKWKDYNDLIAAIASNDLAAVAAVLRYGLGLSDIDAGALPELIYRSGLDVLREPLIDFVFRLYNGGRTVAEVRNRALPVEAGARGEVPAA